MNFNNLREINNLNQRGGRMLSIVDLIERNTIPLEVAAYFFDAIISNASFLICSRPNLAGKTAVQAALLGLIPDSEQIITIKDEKHLYKIYNERILKLKEES
ncbi:MAG: hypothetical protein ACTSRZ_03315 [Promethearchaeota archaeon]